MYPINSVCHVKGIARTENRVTGRQEDVMKDAAIIGLEDTVKVCST